MGPSVRPTIPSCVCKYCLVCVGTLPSSTFTVLTSCLLYNDCIVLYCVVVYRVDTHTLLTYCCLSCEHDNRCVVAGDSHLGWIPCNRRHR